MVPKNDRGEYFRVARVIPPQNRMESIDIRLYILMTLEMLD